MRTLAQKEVNKYIMKLFFANWKLVHYVLSLITYFLASPSNHWRETLKWFPRFPWSGFYINLCTVSYKSTLSFISVLSTMRFKKHHCQTLVLPTFEKGQQQLSDRGGTREATGWDIHNWRALVIRKHLTTWRRQRLRGKSGQYHPGYYSTPRQQNNLGASAYKFLMDHPPI